MYVNVPVLGAGYGTDSDHLMRVLGRPQLVQLVVVLLVFFLLLLRIVIITITKYTCARSRVRRRQR